MACIFLAAKIEENCRRVRDIANVFHHLKQKRTGRYVASLFLPFSHLPYWLVLLSFVCPFVAFIIQFFFSLDQFKVNKCELGYDV